MELQRGTCVLCTVNSKIVSPPQGEKIIRFIKYMLAHKINTTEFAHIQSTLKVCPPCLYNILRADQIRDKIKKSPVDDDSRKCILCKSGQHLLQTPDYVVTKIENILDHGKEMKPEKNSNICLDCYSYLDILQNLHSKLLYKYPTLRPDQSKAVKDKKTKSDQNSEKKEQKNSKYKTEENSEKKVETSKRTTERKSVRVFKKKENVGKRESQRVKKGVVASIIVVSSDEEGAHVPSNKKASRCDVHFKKTLGHLVAVRKTSYKFEDKTKSDFKLFSQVPYVKLLSQTSDLVNNRTPRPSMKIRADQGAHKDSSEKKKTSPREKKSTFFKIKLKEKLSSQRKPRTKSPTVTKHLENSVKRELIVNLPKINIWSHSEMSDFRTLEEGSKKLLPDKMESDFDTLVDTPSSSKKRKNVSFAEEKNVEIEYKEYEPKKMVEDGNETPQKSLKPKKSALKVHTDAEENDSDSDSDNIDGTLNNIINSLDMEDEQVKPCDEEINVQHKDALKGVSEVSNGEKTDNVNDKDDDISKKESSKKATSTESDSGDEFQTQKHDKKKHFKPMKMKDFLLKSDSAHKKSKTKHRKKVEDEEKSGENGNEFNTVDKKKNESDTVGKDTNGINNEPTIDSQESTDNYKSNQNEDEIASNPDGNIHSDEEKGVVENERKLEQELEENATNETTDSTSSIQDESSKNQFHKMTEEPLESKENIENEQESYEGTSSEEVSKEKNDECFIIEEKSDTLEIEDNKQNISRRKSNKPGPLSRKLKRKEREESQNKIEKETLEKTDIASNEVKAVSKDTEQESKSKPEEITEKDVEKESKKEESHIRRKPGPLSKKLKYKSKEAKPKDDKFEKDSSVERSKKKRKEDNEDGKNINKDICKENERETTKETSERKRKRGSLSSDSEDGANDKESKRSKKISKKKMRNSDIDSQSTNKDKSGDSENVEKKSRVYNSDSEDDTIKENFYIRSKKEDATNHDSDSTSDEFDILIRDKQESLFDELKTTSLNNENEKTETQYTEKDDKDTEDAASQETVTEKVNITENKVDERIKDDSKVEKDADNDCEIVETPDSERLKSDTCESFEKNIEGIIDTEDVSNDCVVVEKDNATSKDMEDLSNDCVVVEKDSTQGTTTSKDKEDLSNDCVVVEKDTTQGTNTTSKDKEDLSNDCAVVEKDSTQGTSTTSKDNEKQEDSNTNKKEKESTYESKESNICNIPG